ncbi:hypothetical protein ACM66Z_06385 [Sulfurovum sp. ST-21]|uniref:LPS export ABC transporter periplasmic protein LptC n=1 Tax=Sulfurovum indicum TaxID=2779528 RepID=A0A7M1S0R0_9BACT|nr:hypothetical protein [Sulfurovum indicum]QOR61085.1 hypothetical protein IMZ28_06340 [Sulfurovum indicum]
MGLKLELLLVLLIAFTSVLTMSIQLSDQKVLDEVFDKELEFTGTTFTEVTIHKREGVAYGTRGTRIAGILTIENLRYSNENIELLLADKGRYEDNRIYLDGNVSLMQKEGFKYYTEHAYYDKSAEVIYVTSPFVAYLNKNVIQGETLQYDTVRKEAFATMLKAVVYTAEK